MDNLIFIFETRGFPLAAYSKIPLFAFPCCDYEWVLWSLSHTLSSASFPTHIPRSRPRWNLKWTKLRITLLKPVKLMEQWSPLCCVCVCVHFYIKSGIHRCSGTTVTTSLFLAEAAHTWVSLQQGNRASVHVTRGVCEWGADKHPAVSRWCDWEHGKQKEGESCGKLNWALNTRGDHSHLHRAVHTHKQTGM